MLNLIPFAQFCDIVQIWKPDWVIFLDMHMQVCVTPNIATICGLVLIFLCVLLSVSDDTDYS